MRYLNQLEYADIPYPTDKEHPDSRFFRDGTIKMAGCGLCSICMMIDRLTLHQVSIEECRDWAIECGANHGVGTDMKILAPYVAEKFHLRYRPSSDADELTECLRKGGCAIANTGGDRDGYQCTFSKGGHYILVVSVSGDRLCILDPSWRPDKYTEEPQKSRVLCDGKWLYCDKSVLARDTDNRTPSYYLFERPVPAQADASSAESFFKKI